MTIDDLGHQPGERATTRGYRLKHHEAVFICLERALDALDLTANFFDTEKQLLAITSGVSHPSYIPYWGILSAAKRDAIESTSIM